MTNVRIMSLALGVVALAGCTLDALPGNGRAICAQPPERCPDGYYCAPDDTCWRLGQAPDLSADYSACPDEGTPCGVAPDACHDAPTCKGGVCSPNVKKDGTVCADPKMPCLDPGLCANGVCGAPTNKKDATPCTTPMNPCIAPGTCTGGVCGAESQRQDGYQYDMSDYKFRCCLGQPSTIDSATNCGACGLACLDGNTCYHYAGMQYWCTCPGDSSKCMYGCCSFDNPMNYCAQSTCGNPAHCRPCPGNATCTEGSPHYFCHY
jgi:hypothetical protein